MADSGVASIPAARAAMAQLPALLSAVESALVCPLCASIFNGALTTPCNHTFCPKCLQSALAASSSSFPRCPACRASIPNMSDCYVNKALDAASYQFGQLRTALTTILQAPPPWSSSATKQTGEGEDQRGRRHKRAGETESSGTQGGRVASSGRLDVGSPEHSAFYAGQKKLPLRVYRDYSDKLLRSDLAKWGLPTYGPKDVLIRRHKEYTALWNAQLFAYAPLPPQALPHVVLAAEKGRRVGGAHDTLPTTSSSSGAPAPAPAAAAVAVAAAMRTVSSGPVGGPARNGKSSMTAICLFDDDDEEDESASTAPSVPQHPRGRPPRHQVSFPWQCDVAVDQPMLNGWRRLADEIRARRRQASTTTAATVGTLSSATASAQSSQDDTVRLVFSDVTGRTFAFDTATGSGRFVDLASTPSDGAPEPAPASATAGDTLLSGARDVAAHADAADHDSAATAASPSRVRPTSRIEISPGKRASPDGLSPPEGSAKRARVAEDDDASVSTSVSDRSGSARPAAKEWACSQCTFVNAKLARKCKMCGTRKNPLSI